MFFMDLKQAFKHFSKGGLLAQMIQLRIDGKLVTWTGSFWMDGKMELVIDGHDNKE